MPSIKSTVAIAVLATATTAYAQRYNSYYEDDSLYARDFDYEQEDSLYAREEYDDEFDLHTRSVVENYLAARSDLEELLYIREAAVEKTAAKPAAAKPAAKTAAKPPTADQQIKKGAAEKKAGKADTAQANKLKAQDKKLDAKKANLKGDLKAQQGVEASAKKLGNKAEYAAAEKAAKSDQAGINSANAREKSNKATIAKDTKNAAALNAQGNKDEKAGLSKLGARDLDYDFLDYYYW